MKKIIFLLLSLLIFSCSEDNTNNPTISKKTRVDVTVNGTLQVSYFFNGDNRLTYDERYYKQYFGYGITGALIQRYISFAYFPYEMILGFSEAKLGAITEIDPVDERFTNSSFEYDSLGYLKQITMTINNSDYINTYAHFNGKLLSGISDRRKLTFLYTGNNITSVPEAGLNISYKSNYPVGLIRNDEDPDTIRFSYKDNYRKIIVEQDGDYEEIITDNNVILKRTIYISNAVYIIAKYTYDKQKRLIKSEIIYPDNKIDIGIYTYTEIE